LERAVDLRRTIVNEFESEEECNMFIMVLEKNLPLAKDVIGSAKVEIMKSDHNIYRCRRCKN